MKFKSFLLAVLVTAFLSSYMSRDIELKEGSNAPEIERVAGENITPGDGKEKLISFWSPKDPASRMANMEYSKKYSDSDVEFISVCLDSDNLLGEEVLKYDGIKGTHLAYSDVKERVFKDYGVTDQTAAFKISGNGKVEKVMK